MVIFVPSINSYFILENSFLYCSDLIWKISLILDTISFWEIERVKGYLLELESIAAAVIGGVSLFGGIGTVFGAMLGAILIRFLESGIIMARIDAEWFRAGLGSLIIISVVVNTYISRRATTLGQNKSKE